MDDTARVRSEGGLPVELTRFIGRRAEVAEVKEALGRERLVTLMGVGGVGKTRIGLRVAREVQETFPAGAYFVELSELRDPELLPNAVSSVVDLSEQSEHRTPSSLEALVSYFGDKRLLLVLDTCEHLIDACARFVQAVLRRCPEARILATTRQPLDVPGEYLLHIAPLDAPDPDDEAAASGEPSDAMVLFADRAASVRHGFRLTDANRDLVARICHRLDGIPLALELAAVRLRALPLEQTLQRLDHRFGLLTRGSRAGLFRHQTLRATIDWSHELCSASEQLLWRRLSVFAGEFELAAVEEICRGPDLPADEILEHLIGLVDKAIVLRVDAGTSDDEKDGARYRILDTLREYGRERLAAFGEEREYRFRHRDHYLALAVEFSSQWLSDEQVPWFRRMRREHPNLRGALEFCCTTEGESATGLEMATALWGLWPCTGRVDEGHYWLDRLLSLCPDPSPVRMRALFALGDLALMSGRHARGAELTEEAAMLAELYDDPSAMAYVTKNRLLVHNLAGEAARAMDLLTEARRRFADLGERGAEAWVMSTVAGGCVSAGEYDPALKLCEQTPAVLAAPRECWLLGWLAWMKGAALWGLGRFDESGESLRTALVKCHRIDHTQGLAFSFDTLGWLAAAEEQYEQAALHLGTATKLWERFHEPRLGAATMHQAHEDAVAKARRALGEARYREFFDEGVALPLGQAMAGVVDPRACPEESVTEPDADWETLTSREQEIAALVAEGLSNRQIAERLVISKRTVDSHIGHIMSKLGYSSRLQIATHVLSRARRK
ncbi:ATP-binding protein [Streptomyces albicerus]|uniref:ATP-binding protein n=1 Tax=Streptomyces albicerus TaxID=2569859 RepID=UPI00124B8F82|nr:LuxR C-terminal-related transcriptional regulator [Streptomyces albicerus]